MKLKIPYPGLSETLLYLKKQVIFSMPFAKEYLPAGKMTIPEIWEMLKADTIYFNDPYRIELLQSMPTLFGEENQHHIYGAGDCDCFTIAALTCLTIKGYKNIFVCLAGRNQYAPAHIYVQVDGIIFDLTNSVLGKERPYPYIQRLPFKI